MSQQPNNVIKIQLTLEEVGIIVLTLHAETKRMLAGLRTPADMEMIYPISKLASQLDTAAHNLGQCADTPPGDCAYEENQVTHYRLFKDFIKNEIKPGNKTV